MKKIVSNLFCFIVTCISILTYIFFRIKPDYENYSIARLDGLLTEIFGGLIFIVLLIIILKPSINICTHIAELPANGDIAEHLRFKIVNTSLFKAYDLQIRIFHRERTNTSGADISSELIASFEGYEVGISYLQGGLQALFEDTKTNAAQFRFFRIVNEAGSDIKIKEILNSRNSYLEIHVYVRNGLSGLQGNFIKKYHNITSIKSGYYKHGFYTDVLN